jgi:protoheme IX farnesyltransferase
MMKKHLQRRSAKEIALCLLSLCKPGISFYASMSAVAGLIIASRSPWAAVPLVGAGVFLMACGACAFNQYQERATDALMARTAGRPIPTGRIEPRPALFLSAALLCAGCTVLGLTGPPAAPLLGIAAVLWYNGFYTWFKARNAFAAIPGAMAGAVPPAIGWVVGGGSLLDPRLAFLCCFFFMWQVPHFFAHQLAFGKEYEEIGFPSLIAVFTGPQLKRLICQWLIAAAVGLQVVIYGLIGSPFVRAALLAVSLWAAAIGIRVMTGRRPGYTGAFRATNYFILAVMLLIFLDKLY